METKENMFIGKNILQSNVDIMEPISIEELYGMIKDPEPQLIELTTRLMKVKSIDEKAFQAQKVKLPYFIGASFTENLRNTENFIAIHWLIVDIDKCFNTLEKEIEVKEMFATDRRLALMFTSPSNEGLKLVFRLAAPITDSALYANFYKAFTAELARNYKMEKYIDFKTSDVTRVCFINTDAEAIYNDKAEHVDWRSYLSKYDLINRSETSEESTGDNEDKKGLEDNVYADILQKLNPKTPKRKKQIFVPEALNSITEPIINFAKKTGLSVEQISDINYGKKITFKRNNDFAEINVFYGKSGFSVVISPKRGHHPGLSDVAKALIEKVIFDDPVRSRNLEMSESKVLSRAMKDINLN
jgi:hypothetical protein